MGTATSPVDPVTLSHAVSPSTLDANPDQARHRSSGRAVDAPLASTAGTESRARPHVGLAARPGLRAGLDVRARQVRDAEGGVHGQLQPLRGAGGPVCPGRRLQSEGEQLPHDLDRRPHPCDRRGQDQRFHFHRPVDRLRHGRRRPEGVAVAEPEHAARLRDQPEDDPHLDRLAHPKRRLVPGRPVRSAAPARRLHLEHLHREPRLGARSDPDPRSYYRNSLFFTEDTLVSGRHATSYRTRRPSRTPTTITNVLGASATMPLGEPADHGDHRLRVLGRNTTQVTGTDEPQTIGNLVYAQVNRQHQPVRHGRAVGVVSDVHGRVGRHLEHLGDRLLRAAEWPVRSPAAWATAT